MVDADLLAPALEQPFQSLNEPIFITFPGMNFAPGGQPQKAAASSSRWFYTRF
jgi:hypothetical protein